MLSIINSSRMCDMGLFYGVTSEFFNKLISMVTDGENKTASTIATYSNSINEKLAELVEFYEK